MPSKKMSVSAETITVDLDKQAREILEKAKERGVEYSYLFITTFHKYQELTKRLKELQAAIEEDGATITKEYVKGRANLYVHPAVAAYNTTSRAADSAAALLLKYIETPLAGGGETGDAFDSFKGNE